jgi:hypothetical protein
MLQSLRTINVCVFFDPPNCVFFLPPETLEEMFQAQLLEHLVK